MWSARAYEAKRVCLGVKHNFAKSWKVQEIEPNHSQVHSYFGSCIHARVLEIQNLGWKGKQAPIWVPKISLKNIKFRYLKCTHIVHLDLKCMNYDQMKGQESPIWLSTTNPFKTRVKWALIGACNTPFKTYFWGL